MAPAFTVTAPVGPMSYHGTHPSITARIAGIQPPQASAGDAAGGTTTGNDTAATAPGSASSPAVSSNGASAKTATELASAPGSATAAAPAAGAAVAENVPVEKVKRYVTARCGRCGTHLSNWTVKTPVRRSSATNGMIAEASAAAAAAGTPVGAANPGYSGLGAPAATTTTAPLPNPAKSTSTSGPTPSVAAAGAGAVTTPTITIPSPTSPLPTGTNAAPGDPASTSDSQSATAPCFCDPDPSDLFPSHVKKTWLGPESVLVFPNILGAKALLGKAVELDLSKANDLAIDHQDDVTGEHREAGKISLAAAMANGTPGNANGTGHLGGIQGQGANRGGAGLPPAAASPSPSKKMNGGSNSAASGARGKAGRPKIANGTPGAEKGAAHSHWTFAGSGDKVSHALACPACSFLLASSPTCPYLGVKGRTVIYQPSLRLESTTDVPAASTEPNSPANALDDARPGESDFGTEDDGDVPAQIKPSHHDALPLIRSKGEFEEILLRSALAPIHHFADGSKSKSNIESSDSLASEYSSDHPILRGQGSADSNDDVYSIDDESEDDELYGTRNPAELVILVVGQFWSPYSVSAVTRLSDYKRRHEPGGNERSRSIHPDPMLSGIGGAGPGVAKGNPAFARPHRRTVSVPPNLAALSTSAASSPNKTKPGHKPTRSTGGEDPQSSHGGGSHSAPACTFLLLDTFHNADSVGEGEGGGGVDPSAVLGKELASTVRCLPIPFFLVWYRGCPVRVTNASQHFRCQRGAVVGLDLARYVDIVVPRIAAEARQAFRRSLLSARAAKSTETRRSSGLDSGSNGTESNISSLNDNESNGLEQPADAEGLFWSQVTDVPELKDRPILDIKL